MTYFRLPSFFTTWLENMFSDFSARQIVRERYFKRQETAKTSKTSSFSKEKPAEKKDTIRSIRKIRITAASN